MKNNKLTMAIKKWYRGKQAPPLEVELAGKTHKLPSEKYIQPFAVRLFFFIVGAIKFIINFIRKEWRTIVPITIALISLYVAILALLTK